MNWPPAAVVWLLLPYLPAAARVAPPPYCAGPDSYHFAPFDWTVAAADLPRTLAVPLGYAAGDQQSADDPLRSREDVAPPVPAVVVQGHARVVAHRSLPHLPLQPVLIEGTHTCLW